MRLVQADWEIEWGGDVPVIDACWPGCVHLRAHPERISSVVEVDVLPGLKDALARLNQMDRPFWTAKCDVWTLDEVDPDELDAPRPSATNGIACYIDLLPASPMEWREPSDALACCKEVCGALAASPLCACRADLVIRRAYTGPGQDAAGVTIYLSACGANSSEAKARLEAALAVFADSVESTASRDPACPKLQ
jgi:hypothetical protein